MIRNSESSSVFLLGIRNSQSSPVLFGRSEILNRSSLSMEEFLGTGNSENHLDSYAWLKH